MYLLRTKGIFPLLGEEPYRAIISASLRQRPLVPRVGGGVPWAARSTRNLNRAPKKCVTFWEERRRISP